MLTQASDGLALRTCAPKDQFSIFAFFALSAVGWFDGGSRIAARGGEAGTGGGAEVGIACPSLVGKAGTGEGVEVGGWAWAGEAGQVG
jgi:hypothetical protein